ncbi:MAG: methyltransferase domain-containing protein [Pseudolabrys sp.]|jgi:SAM-dependent methyltransferase
MAAQKIRFDDGAAYERMMGIWSRGVGEDFLDWLNLPKGLKCVDVGCGNGAFTELLVERCRPVEVQGIDPSSEQIAFARTRHTAKIAEFRQADAMALPFPDSRFDAATMALVIFFVPEPAKGVAEMARAVRRGGAVAAYAWDMLGGGFPMTPILSEVRALGKETVGPPSVEASRMESLRELWGNAGLEAVETRKITVQRTFRNFDDFWTASTGAGSVRATVDALSRDEVETVKARLRAKLLPDAEGRITHSAFANAIKGRVRK